MWVRGELDLRMAKGPKKTAGKADKPLLKAHPGPSLKTSSCITSPGDSSHRVNPDSVWEEPTTRGSLDQGGESNREHSGCTQEGSRDSDIT